MLGDSVVDKLRPYRLGTELRHASLADPRLPREEEDSAESGASHHAAGLLSSLPAHKYALTSPLPRFVTIYLFIYLFICLSVCVSLCLSAHYGHSNAQQSSV